jgi:hypothetical protein
MLAGNARSGESLATSSKSVQDMALDIPGQMQFMPVKFHGWAIPVRSRLRNKLCNAINILQCSIKLTIFNISSLPMIGAASPFSAGTIV